MDDDDFSQWKTTDSEDTRHERCPHSNLPAGPAFIAHINLKNHSENHIVDLTLPFDTQEPETARIIFCKSADIAASIYRHLGNKEAASHLEETIRVEKQHREKVNALRNTEERLRNIEEKFASAYWNSTAKDKLKRPIDARRHLLPYDPRRILRWINIREGSTVVFAFSEILFFEGVLGQVKNQIHIKRDSNNRYTILWFDFGRVFDTSFDPSYKPEEQRRATERTHQQRFAYSLHHPGTLLCSQVTHPSDFATCLLMDILNTDLQCFEPYVLDLASPDSSGANYPLDITLDVAQKTRFRYFALLQGLIEKAEMMNATSSLLKSTLPQAIVSADQRGEIIQNNDMYSVSCNYLLSMCLRKNTREQELLSLFTQVVQARQGRSMSALTYCAAFFLPLSLSASMLSMQTRMKDLDGKIYDFFTLACAFCTCSLVVYYGQRLLSNLASVSWVRKLEVRKKEWPLVKYALVAVWITAVVLLFWNGFVKHEFIGMISFASCIVGGCVLYGFILAVYVLGTSLSNRVRKGARRPTITHIQIIETKV